MCTFCLRPLSSWIFMAHDMPFCSAACRSAEEPRLREQKGRTPPIPIAMRRTPSVQIIHHEQIEASALRPSSIGPLTLQLHEVPVPVVTSSTAALPLLDEEMPRTAGVASSVEAVPNPSFDETTRADIWTSLAKRQRVVSSAHTMLYTATVMTLVVVCAGLKVALQPHV
jgi:hypothetical protein